MTNRKKFGLIFTHYENWTGGTYYIMNLVHALNTLLDEKKPIIILFCNSRKEFKYLVSETNYPHILFEKLPKQKTINSIRVLNAISKMIFKKNIFLRQFKREIDLIFPNPRGIFFEKVAESKKYFWISDFQEEYFPYFFDSTELAHRKHVNINISLFSEKLILSSLAAKKDFVKFYPFARTSVSILNFAVTHPQYNHINIEELKQKYKIPKTYFFSPNQFWIHKNHITVIKAIELLKNKGKEVIVLFSGKEYDHRDAKYADGLKNYVKDNDLSSTIRFLGFIDRKEQLQIMKHANAIIQPSFFEGWSTVIEDAKAMNQLVIASHLDVHIEQLGASGLFFDPNCPQDLADNIEKAIDSTPRFDYNYSEKIKEFGRKFYEFAE